MSNRKTDPTSKRISPRKGVPNVTPEQTEKMLDLQRQGRTQASIATAVGLSRDTVGRALKRENDRTMRRMARRATAEKARQLEVIDQVIETSMELLVDGRDIKAAPEVRASLAERRKILGMDAPAEVNASVSFVDPATAARMIKAAEPEVEFDADDGD